MSPRSQPEVRRREILEAAHSCFAERGYHETTVDDIAGRAGLSKGAIYWHFENKRELFLALFDNYVAELAQVLEQAAELSLEEALTSLGDTLLKQLPDTVPMAEVSLEYMAHAMRDEAVRERFRGMYALFADVLCRQVERGVAQGELRPVDPEAAAAIVIAIYDGILMQSVMLGEQHLQRAWGHAAGIALRGLKA